MDIELLHNIGLTSGESKVYLALLKIGQCSVGEIIGKSGIARSKIYDILERLRVKGLVSYILEGKVKKFNAISPTRLYEFLELEKEKIADKEKELQRIIPYLEKISPNEDKASAEIFSGSRGIKAFFDMSLYKNKGEVLVLGYSKEASLYFHSYFRDYHKKRIQRKIPGRVIYDYDTWYLKKRGKRKYVQQRYLPKDIKTPAFVYMFGDYVGTVIFSNKNKLCFLIKDKEVFESYKEYFNLLWKIAKKE
jgi:sugar-specific transcriptional regulator TrmB